MLVTTAADNISFFYGDDSYEICEAIFSLKIGSGRPDSVENEQVYFIMLPKGRAYSRSFVRPSDCPSICPSHFCQEHISKSIKGNLMKLDTLIEGHEWNCRMQEP